MSNDAALRIKAAHLGLDAAEHQPTERVRIRAPARLVRRSRPRYEVIDCLYAAGAVDVAAVRSPRSPADAHRERVRRAAVGSQSALTRRVGDELVLLPHAVPEAWGLRPRNKEQRFALELLLDPDVASSPSTAGPAPARRSWRSPPRLEQVVEQPRYERLAVYRPLVPVGRADVGFLPGGLDEKLDPWMSAIHDAIVALTDRSSSRDARHLIDELTAATSCRSSR